MWKCHSLCKKRVPDLCIHIFFAQKATYISVTVFAFITSRWNYLSYVFTAWATLDVILLLLSSCLSCVKPDASHMFLFSFGTTVPHH